MSKAHSHYPVAYGNEEELSVHIPGYGEDGVVESRVLAVALEGYKKARRQANGSIFVGRFSDAGGIEYIDGKHPEIGSPESPTIEELLPRMQGNEKFTEGYAPHLLAAMPGVDRIGIHRRTIDGRGNTFGCHDNFGVLGVSSDEQLARMLVGHSVTRACVTGAGYSDGRTLYFSQKLNSLTVVNAYGYKSTVFRTTDCEGTTRVESRASDVNISPDAARLRLGGMAMAISIARTPSLAEWFNNFYEEYLSGAAQAGVLGDAAMRFNKMPLNGDFDLVYSKPIDVAATYQLQLAETFMSDKMKEKSGEQPPELMAIAKDLYEYAEDMRAVLRGGKHFSLLSDRADWAAKHKIHVARLNRDRQTGLVRSKSNLTTMRDDLAYDYTEVRCNRDDRGKFEVVKSGTGYKLRDQRNQFRTRFTDEEVEEAMKRPPKGGRAELRSKILREREVISCYWNACLLTTQDDGEVTVSMREVHKNKLVPAMRSKLATTRKRYVKPQDKGTAA